MRILLVDDDLAIRLMLAVFLKPYGDCAEAGSGEGSAMNRTFLGST